jgi:hypothetical protein
MKSVSKSEILRKNTEALIQDMSIANSLLGSSTKRSPSKANGGGDAPSWFDTVCLLPFVELKGGEVYSNTDFITGLVQMNRTMFNCSMLSDEAKRKSLFGSDQIIA